MEAIMMGAVEVPVVTDVAEAGEAVAARAHLMVLTHAVVVDSLITQSVGSSQKCSMDGPASNHSCACLSLVRSIISGARAITWFICDGR